MIITALDETISLQSRKLGTLEGKATVSFAEDWNMDDDYEDFVLKDRTTYNLLYR